MPEQRSDRKPSKPWLFDGVLAIGLLGFSVDTIRSELTDSGAARSLLTVGAIVVMALATTVVRVWPVPTALLIGFAVLGFIGVAGLPVVAGLAAPYAIYAVAWLAQERAMSFAALIAGIGGAVVAAAVWGGLGMVSLLGDLQVPQFLVVLAIVLPFAVAAWLIGDRRRARDTLIASYAERARLLEAEVAQQSMIGAAAERRRIARDLHDVIAHSLTVMIVQADGAKAMLKMDLAQTEHALDQISNTGREALAEARSVLGVLREQGAETDYRPQPGLADLDALVQASGPQARLIKEGTPRELRMSHQIALYRVAQEALTNIRKHAGTTSAVLVELIYDDNSVELTVNDDGLGGSATTYDGNGSGLRGMRERVDAVGGSLQVGPRPSGGFVVIAHLPSPYADQPQPVNQGAHL